ncbi:hypothetical protein P60_gp04 [Synechococcus phage P60]|uniref:Uncharacterized protein n=1 Tax=Synechococcus phage P60 TaxID=2905923 RepID=Q8W727_9CAUD|nr:hypothetical protein P60_gp04 [Synechococcus phage P60]AAL73250.2 hypothetical protein P60_gp04 [Synechococcus phage P60]
MPSDVIVGQYIQRYVLTIVPVLVAVFTAGQVTRVYVDRAYRGYLKVAAAKQFVYRAVVDRLTRNL